MERTGSVSDCKTLAERRAAKCGFNAASIVSERFRSTGPFDSDASGSPRLTIPPGISPTALLDSPIMLLNSQALPSPTTGTFSVSPLNHGTEGNDSVFRLRLPSRPDSLTAYSSSENQGTDVDYQTLVSANLSRDFKYPSEFSNEATSKNCSEDLYGEVKFLESMVPAQNAGIRVCSSDVASDQISHQKPIHGEDLGTRRHLDGDQKGTYSSMEISRTSEDGYNWRKYGQKQVKGSEYPRSYYKCTHPNCQVKKKVERSHDGQITEIIYKSSHNHPKPQPSRRATLGLSFSFNDTLEVGEGSGSCAKAEGGAVWRNIQMGSRDSKLSSNWRADGLERTSSASVLTEISDPSSTVFDSAGTPELLSTLASPDDDEDESHQGSISLANDDDADSKRRKTESCLMETSFASRAIREPKVVVQIESEVDILDDGYRWRKYGQKVVKGNPNPRSYYKCTSAGCVVRKHVERASHNLKCVLTTYEGKHNHEVPAARNSSNGGNIAATLARTNVPKPEARVEGFASRYDRKYELGNEYLRSSLLANYGNEMKFNAASMYQMKLPPPPLQQTMCYGSFGLNPIPNQRVRQQLMVPDFSMSLPLSIHQIQSANPSIGPESYLSGQVPMESDMRFLRPKQEAIINNANPPSSLYGHIFQS